MELFWMPGESYPTKTKGLIYSEPPKVELFHPIHNSLVGRFKHFFVFTPTWGKIPILTFIFSNGLVQPPTS